MPTLLRFAGRTKIPKWAIWAAIATPAAAVLQGCVLLYEFRKNHGNAPHPVSPSRGVVVVSPEDLQPEGKLRLVTSASRHPDMVSTHHPLRLLVIGDSLAAGVGTSKSGTPVLPESIARSLSKALGGRAVYWTCVGTPGASAAQIVSDIHSFDDGPSESLRSKLTEFYEAKDRAQKWLEAKRKTQKRKFNLDDLRNGPVRDKLKNWWQEVKRDAQDFKKVVQTKTPGQDRGSSSDYSEEIAKDRSRRLVRRNTVYTNGNYDVAVVLTGLNDLKNVVIPFMMQGENATTVTEDARAHTASDLLEELTRVLRALKSKMKLDLRNDKHDVSTGHVDDDKISSKKSVSKLHESHQDSKQESHRGPLVVFPALPASPLPLLQYPPLKWFAIPLIKAMDHNKKLLSEKFPGLVLFVDSPSRSTLLDIEAGRGPLWDSRLHENVLFSPTDVTRKARDKVENLMKHHYAKWAAKITNDRESSIDDDHHNENRASPPDVFEQSCHDHQLVDSAKIPGATLIAADNVHPNDDGYDFWGRHIGEAIVKEWNSEKKNEDGCYSL